MIKLIFGLCAILILHFKSQCQNGYILNFGGDFDSSIEITVRVNQNYLMKGKASVNPSSGLSKLIMYLDSTNFDKLINIQFSCIDKSIEFPLSSNVNLQYIYVWKKKNKVSFEIRNVPLKLE